ncbi:hypothetical protein [Ostreibacterium oceani]|uniref:Uncharacterized protein n=1 Tax=Ostreibacterium oceani TaxID=2654998 RepID=A0A6N7ETJ4_9GAMM|nr:hypothetical protein [Ostreibacterium oceani]MPV86134.1 hypothetical protein [Ostreibacterium oceani]
MKTTLIALYRLVLFIFILFLIRDTLFNLPIMRELNTIYQSKLLYATVNVSIIIITIVLWFIPNTILGISEYPAINNNPEHAIAPFHIVFFIGLIFFLYCLPYVIDLIITLFFIKNINTTFDQSYLRNQLITQFISLSLAFILMRYCRKISRLFTL